MRAQTDDEPSPLVRAQTQYKNAVADIRTAAEEARAKTFTKYGKTLEHLAETYQKRGYLDALLAVKKEIERFKRDAYIPADPPPGLPTLLEKTQTQVHVALADIDLDRALSVIRLTGDYITHLDTLMRRLTTEGKLEEAVAVRDAIASAKQAPAYTAALFEKAALELSTSTDAEDKQNPSQRDADPTKTTDWHWTWNTHMGERGARDLTSEGMAKITREGMITKGGRIVADGLGEIIHTRVTAANAITLEVAFRTDSVRQSGPARIVGCSLDAYVRNVSLCQERDKLLLRLRTTKSGRDGNTPDIHLGEISDEELHHVTISYRPGELVCVLDGEIREVQQVSGDLSNWEKFPLVFGNDAKIERPWRGTITHVSIESAFTSAKDAAKRFAARKREMK